MASMVSAVLELKAAVTNPAGHHARPRQFALGMVRATQVMPSVLVAADALFALTAKNMPPPYSTDVQALVDGSVRRVHVMPSGLVDTRLEASDMATNIPLPNVMSIYPLNGIVRGVHVMPSGLVAALLLDQVTATKTPFPKTAACHAASDGIARAVHVMPSGLVAAAVET